MASIACFFLEATDRQFLRLRRYVSPISPSAGEIARCPLKPGVYSYHDAEVPFGECPIRREDDRCIKGEWHREPPKDDPRWPTRCGCGFSFRPEDEWQLTQHQIYVRGDNGQETTIHEAGPGALYYAWWMEERAWNEWVGPDGRILMCTTPGGPWCLDSRASNCDRKDDNTHRCWCRHGNPRDPKGKVTGQPLHVDKNGNTCNAGAGSILFDNYHGFLHGGHLVSC